MYFHVLSHLITLENISRVNFLFHIIKALVVTVCNDGVAHFLELRQIVDHHRAKECLSILQSRLINHHGCSLGLNALHDTLDRTLAEVVAVTLHGQTVHTDGDCLFLVFIKLILCIVAVVTSQLQNYEGTTQITEMRKVSIIPSAKSRII